MQYDFVCERKWIRRIILFLIIIEAMQILWSLIFSWKESTGKWTCVTTLNLLKPNHWLFSEKICAYRIRSPPTCVKEERSVNIEYVRILCVVVRFWWIFHVWLFNLKMILGKNHSEHLIYRDLTKLGHSGHTGELENWGVNTAILYSPLCSIHNWKNSWWWNLIIFLANGLIFFTDTISLCPETIDKIWLHN